MVVGFTIVTVGLMSNACNVGLVGTELVIDFGLEFIQGLFGVITSKEYLPDVVLFLKP